MNIINKTARDLYQHNELIASSMLVCMYTNRGGTRHDGLTLTATEWQRHFNNQLENYSPRYQELSEDCIRWYLQESPYQSRKKRTAEYLLFFFSPLKYILTSVLEFLFSRL